MIRPFKVSSAYAALDSNRLGCHIRKIIILLAYDVFVFGRAFSGLRERTRRRISRSCLKNDLPFRRAGRYYLLGIFQR